MDGLLVAIVGRPNVGKSSLLNRLAGRRVAIVDSTPGTTRDRVTAWVEHRDRRFEIVDTGGMGIRDIDNLTAQVEAQVEITLREADVIVFVTDVREGVTPLDVHVAQRLRGAGRPVIVAVNKTDSAAQEGGVGEFYGLGFGEPTALSAREGYGCSDLLDRVVESLPGSKSRAPENPTLKLAVVGRRNAGKSTLINQLCGSERLIVSEVPGTTRDAVDVAFTFNGLPYLAIDTAGMRRRGKVTGTFEYYSQDRARHAVQRADVVVMMLDAREEVSLLDKELAGYVVEECKPLVIAVNKWDLAGEVTTQKYRAYLENRLAGVAFAPLAFLSAKTGEHITEMMRLVRSLHAQASVRVSTGRLNRAFEDAITVSPPPPVANRTGKIYYVTQVGIVPPTIVAFVNDPQLFPASYRHYLQNALRSRLPYAEIPVRIEFKAHEGRTRRPVTKPADRKKPTRRRKRH